MKIIHKFFIISCILLFFTGCSNSKIQLAENRVLLCSNGTEYDAGIVLYGSNGEKLLDLSNARIEAVFSPDGFLLQQTAGQISSENLLYISIDNNTSAGVWDISEQAWAISPLVGSAGLTIKNGKLASLCVGGSWYNSSLQLLENSSNNSDNWFKVSNLLLTNAIDDSGHNYIQTNEGDCYLNADQFSMINYSLNLPMPTSVEITDTVLDKYMIIGGDYYILDQGTNIWHSKHVTYLCDMDGIIQYPEMNHSYIVYPTNQYENLDYNYLKFIDSDGKIDQYIDLATGQQMVFPSGYDYIRYADNGLFILGKDTEYIIYDAINQMSGISFTYTPESNPFVFGLNSYVIQSIDNNKLVIDGVEQKLNANTEIAIVMYGEYPVVLTGKIWGPYDASYIIDSSGSLRLKENGYIIYADSSYYLEVKDNKYIVHSYS